MYYTPFRRVIKRNKLVGLPCGVEYGTIYVTSQWANLVMVVAGSSLVHVLLLYL